MSEGAIRALRPHETRPVRHASPTAKKEPLAHGLGSDSVRIAAVSQAEMSSQTIQPLLASLRSYAQAAVTFMRESNTPLSESHGCLHVSPQDVAILRTYVKVGSRIKIHSYGETSPQVDMPYIEAADRQMKPEDITLEIFPRPQANEDGGFGILYHKGIPLGQFKVTGGPTELQYDKTGKAVGGPTKPTYGSSTIESVDWHLSKKYPDSLIPGGAEIRIADGEHLDIVDVEKFRNRDTGEIIETRVPRNLPELYYREFDYGRNAYTDRWIKITDKDFYQAILRKDPRIELPADYSYDFNSYPFETRYVDGRRTIYYVGSSFGNGDLLPSGERHPQVTFNWGTQEYVHYGLEDEKAYQYLVNYATAYFRGEKLPDRPFNTDCNYNLSEFERTLSGLKSRIDQQAAIFNIGDENLNELVQIVCQMLKGYTLDAQEHFDAFISQRIAEPNSSFYVSVDDAVSGKVTINGVTVKKKIDKDGKTYITLDPSAKTQKDAYKQLILAVHRLQLPKGVILASFDNYSRVKSGLGAILGNNNLRVIITLSEV